MDSAKRDIVERLKHSLQLLVAPAEMQLQLLPDFVCKADELALTFDQWMSVAVSNYNGEFTSDQLAALTTIDDELQVLTHAGPDLWTDTAVAQRSEWQTIRELAKVALKAFGWSDETPPSYTGEYVSNAQGETKIPRARSRRSE